MKHGCISLQIDYFKRNHVYDIKLILLKQKKELYYNNCIQKEREAYIYIYKVYHYNTIWFTVNKDQQKSITALNLDKSFYSHMCLLVCKKKIIKNKNIVTWLNSLNNVVEKTN